MENKLIRIDRNGSKHFEGMVTCDRCGGSGVYAWCVRNGQIIPTIVDNGVCHKCCGKGKVLAKWIERTPEYQAKLDAKRQAKCDAEQAKMAAERESIEALEKAEQEAKEAQIKAEKSISKHVGQIGDRLTLKVTYQSSGSWEQNSFTGFGTVTMYAHTFKDSDGNVFTWKTQNGIAQETDDGWIVPEYGEPMILKGTVKEHTEYKDQKQTMLTRCKLSFV